MAEYGVQFDSCGTSNPVPKLKELKTLVLAACESSSEDAQTVSEIFRVAKWAFAMFCQDKMLSIK
ncbi:hypothetical protein HK100_004699 [Physocladia obscura]|uniref:Uncharacterized protein n=1 Tax=Physocladia obscura TaxID=109957 RepID=A0AAD5SV21_9FUNG|nr:hypothetical protein HK100_004699 [Physocladia obscura]